MWLWAIKTKTNEEMENIKSRLKMLEEHRERCESQHIEHSEHRRRLYDKLDEAIQYLKKISSTMEFIEQNKETIIRTHNNYITTDTMQKWALWGSAIIGCIVAIAALFKMLL